MRRGRKLLFIDLACVLDHTSIDVKARLQNSAERTSLREFVMQFPDTSPRDSNFLSLGKKLFSSFGKNAAAQAKLVPGAEEFIEALARTNGEKHLTWMFVADTTPVIINEHEYTPTILNPYLDAFRGICPGSHAFTAGTFFNIGLDEDYEVNERRIDRKLALHSQTTSLDRNNVMVVTNNPVRGERALSLGYIPVVISSGDFANILPDVVSFLSMPIPAPANPVLLIEQHDLEV